MATNIQSIINSINKEYGDNTISRATDFKNLNIDRIPTGSFFLDYCTGGGFPCGKIVELYGMPSSGKSLISQMVVAEAQKLGGDCVWMDCENCFSPEFAEKFGVNTKKLILSQSTIGETTFDLIFKLIEAEPSVIVVDSVAAMVPMKDAEEPMEQAVMATRARLMSRGLSVLNSKNKKTLIIFINQLRTDIGAYGGPAITTGGRALGFYASVRIEVKRGEYIEKSKEKIGNEIKFRVTKSKVSPPFKEGSFDFYYDGRINHASEIITLGLITKKIEQTGAFYMFHDQKFHGREALEIEANEKPEFVEALKKEIYG